MSEGKKKKRELHVDTLHIHANEVVFHTPDGRTVPFTGPFTFPFTPPGGTPAGAPGGTDDAQGNAPQGPQRDFWGFPLPPMPQAQGNAAPPGDNTDGNPNNQQGTQQGPPPGWI